MIPSACLRNFCGGARLEAASVSAVFRDTLWVFSYPVHSRVADDKRAGGAQGDI